MLRKVLAVFCGVLAGGLLSNAIVAGLQYRFPDEFPLEQWSIFWGEHWFLRAIGSLLSAAWAGFMAGLIGRDRGRVLAVLAVIPGWLFWVMIAFVSFTGYVPFLESTDTSTFHVSLGNKISMVFIILAVFPVAWVTGPVGEAVGKENGALFDSRPRTLLGVDWYHYFWIPILLHLALMHTSFAGYYFLSWLKAFYKSGLSFFSILPQIIPLTFTIMIYGTLYLMWLGLSTAYLILAGYEETESRGKAAMKVLKYAVGFPLVSVILERIIEMTHYQIGKWLS